MDDRVPERSRRIDRRTALRLGGGVIAVAVGVGAGVPDRRSGRGESAPRAVDPVTPGPAPDPTAGTATTSLAPPQSSSHAPGGAQPSAGNDEAAREVAAPQVTAEDVLEGVAAVDIPEGVIAVGEGYLRAVPEEADLATLLAALPAPGGDVAAAARRRIAADFTNGETVAVDGWLLSRSEARAAAALALACAEQC